VNPIKNPIRRRLLQYGVCTCIPSLSGCRPAAPPAVEAQYTDEEKAQQYRFRGIEGFELTIDGMREPLAAVILDDTGYPITTSNYSSERDAKYSRATGATGPMTYLSVTVYQKDAIGDGYGPKGELLLKGKLLGKYKVPIAKRIPDELLDDLRKNGGGLRIKVRLHRDGVLVGWDIERRPGYDPRKRDQWGSAVYVAPVHSFVGGDFREAEIINGKAVRKGWYIHPKTGERIETDF
jgi:hypothetical protein